MNVDAVSLCQSILSIKRLIFPSVHDTSRLSSELDSHAAQWPLLLRKKNAVTKKNVSTMCTRFYKLDSTIALQDIVSCAWQSFLVTLSRNNRSKFLTALLQLDGLSSHSAMLSALATLVPSAFGPLKYVHFGLSVLELGSFMYNFDTRRMNFVEACSYRLDSFSRGM